MAGAFSCENGFLRIVLPKSYHNIIDVKDLKELSKEFFGMDVKLQLDSPEIETDSQAVNGTNHRNNRTQEITHEAINQPHLQKILDLFEGAEVRGNSLSLFFVPLNPCWRRSGRTE
jgi:hypothetical protein